MAPRLRTSSHSPLRFFASVPSASQLTSTASGEPRRGRAGAGVRVVEAAPGGGGLLGELVVLAVVRPLGAVGEPQREALLHHDAPEIDPAPAHAHGDGAAQALAGMARGALRGEADDPPGALDVALDQRGGLEAAALAPAALGVLAVARQLHRVDAGEADVLRVVRPVPVDVDVDRVAVGHERDLAGPEVAQRGGLAGDAGPAPGVGVGGGGDGEGAEQARRGGEEGGEQSAHIR